MLLACFSLFAALPRSAEAFVNPATLVNVAAANMVQSSNGVADLKFDFNPAAGGQTMFMTVVLQAHVPSLSPPLTVALTKSNSSVSISMPSSIQVGAGFDRVKFAITLGRAVSDEDVQITASALGSSLTKILTVQAVRVSGVSFLPTTVKGGASLSGIISLNTKAPKGGIKVSLSDNHGSATTPASVTVKEGQTQVSYTFPTLPVSSPVPVTVFARVSGTPIKSGGFTIQPPLVDSITLSSSEVRGGTGVTGTVRLDHPAPAGGVVVSLTSNRSAVSVPSAVTVPEGQQQVSISIAASPVTTFTQATLYAASSGSRNRYAVLAVTPAQVSALSLSSPVLLGGNAGSGTVVLSDPAPAGGAVVSLTSNRAAVSVPATVTVWEGQTTATFAVTTSPTTTPVQATIVANLDGRTRHAVQTVNPAAIVSHTLAPNTVTGGSGSTGTITLDGAAPAGGLTVVLSSNRASAVVPVSVTIPEGQTSVTYSISTSPVAASTPVTLYASLYGRSRWVVLTVTP